MGKLGNAIKAFMQVMKGQDLVLKSELDKALEQARRNIASTKKELPPPPPPPPPPDRFNEGATYTLLLLQREGRLVDFLQEDLSGATDEQIGIAVRQIHTNCAKALATHFSVQPVVGTPEGEGAKVAADFDPTAIKLTGNVPEAGPYKGTLIHKGWRAAKLHFPARTGKINAEIIQPAEVEI